MLTLATDGGATWYRPGEIVRGTASWSLDGEAESLELRLFWYTTGKGSQDVEIVAREPIELPAAAGSTAFTFRIPRGPYSFSGKLITLAWALELVTVPEGETARCDLLVGPRPVEVDLR